MQAWLGRVLLVVPLTIQPSIGPHLQLGGSSQEEEDDYIRQGCQGPVDTGLVAQGDTFGERCSCGIIPSPATSGAARRS